MTGIRITVDLFIPEKRYVGIPAAARQAILALKALAVVAGKEDTTKAVWHRCHHDEAGLPCEPEQDI